MASNWTLQAIGPTVISGATGTPSVTQATLPPGTYTLREVGGPSGYAASPWECTDGVAASHGQIELSIGTSTTCTITNSDLPLTLRGPAIKELIPAPMLPPWALVLLGLVLLAVGVEALRRYRHRR